MKRIFVMLLFAAFSLSHQAQADELSLDSRGITFSSPTIQGLPVLHNTYFVFKGDQLCQLMGFERMIQATWISDVPAGKYMAMGTDGTRRLSFRIVTLADKESEGTYQVSSFNAVLSSISCR